ncbi:hypothetical protein HYH03_004974 [Edaphochlamys debaryana]|uniref:Uncharacterized protein n=1 Tax=Edaphochlamys debaryana TaxID=47281 RepID=A0A835Y6L2_9CHLO|nr:hypothetical protein HYH03_004974 [Edaphochlamys debaryana]|eukprot:KAG2496968.1 hypothetical protein HYH03_004974 [Edaphochlamys debaryana]
MVISQLSVYNNKYSNYLKMKRKADDAKENSGDQQQPGDEQPKDKRLRNDGGATPAGPALAEVGIMAENGQQVAAAATAATPPPPQALDGTPAAADAEHVAALVSSPASSGLILCASKELGGKMVPVAVAVPLTAMHDSLRCNDLVTVSLVGLIGKSGKGYVQDKERSLPINFKSQKDRVVPWPVAGLSTTFEGKLPTDFGSTADQISNWLQKLRP